MKKIVLILMVVCTVIVAFSSCGSSRRGYGCPAAEGIVH